MSYSKQEQVARSPGNRMCPHGLLRSECQEWSCRNRRNRLSGLKAQTRAGKKIAKGLGVKPGKISNEETTTWPIRWEAKSGRQAEPVFTFYRNCQEQADTQTPIGSKYPFVAVAGSLREGLMVLRVEDFAQLLQEARKEL